MNALKKMSLALVSFSPVAAFAAVPAEVTAELATMKTDALAVAAVVLVAIIAVAAFKFIRRGL